MTKPRNFAVIDCETDPFKRGRLPSDFIWGFYDGDTYNEFTDLDLLPVELRTDTVRDIDEFIPFLFDQEIIVYAHNGGKFDYHFLLDYINQFEPIRIISGRLAQFRIGVCEFRDSWNILPVPLAAYQKQKFDYSILEQDKRYLPHNWRRITRYLYSDCSYLYNIVAAFRERYGSSLTQAGASMKAWRKVSGQPYEQSNLDYYERFKAYYYGGRTEVFRKGIIKRAFRVVDINSAYPHAMLSKHPITRDYENLSREECDEILVTLEGKKITTETYDTHGPCLFHVQGVSRGALPYRHSDGSLFFPNDDYTRDYFVTGWEVCCGLETGTLEIDTIKAAYDFDEVADFSDYILPLYEERKVAKQNGDRETDLLAKLAMNSLYGKFAANPQKYHEYIPVDAEFAGIFDQLETLKRTRPLDSTLADLEGFKFGGMLGPWVLGYKKLAEEKMRFLNVATAASITGFVRAKLWRNLCKCKGLIYCDTDSIAAHDVSQVTIGKELGQWDVEGCFSKGAVAGKKMYAFRYTKAEYKKKLKKKKKGDKKIRPYKIASKGVKFAAWQIYALCRGQEIEYDPQAPSYSIGSEPVQIKRKIKANAKTAKDMKGKK